MSHWKKLSLALAPLVFVSLCPLLLCAQDNMGQTAKEAITVTGCLKQGAEHHGYHITSNGKMYELMGRNLGEHLNHTVTVTGHEVTLSAAEEAKLEASEKSEAGSNQYVDLKVSSLKMVSTSCSE